ncbi:MAG TPA: FAD-dependent oxidoreductase [Euzebyales bacterium]
MIARCRDTSDVAAALRYARSAGMAVAVRGGGHNVAGHALCDGELVIDVSGMRDVTVHPDSGRATVQGGARLGDVDRVAVPAGRLLPSGIVTDTGVGGLTLGGGIGWAMRRRGLTCDHVEAVDLVTADGDLLTADDRSHPELLWGLRGGGGNFGV